VLDLDDVLVALIMNRVLDLDDVLVAIIMDRCSISIYCSITIGILVGNIDNTYEPYLDLFRSVRTFST
jgi:dUTPase